MRVLREIARDTVAIATRLHVHAGPRQLAATIAHDGLQVLALWRIRAAARRWHVPLVDGLLRRVQIGMFGIEIAREAELGEGVIFAHTVGVVIGGNTVVGDGVMFLGSNTTGSLKMDDFPRIERDVIVGAGARILGRVAVGEGARIGANAVVVRDVPAGATAAGVPAVSRMRDAARHDAPGVNGWQKSGA